MTDRLKAWLDKPYSEMSLGEIGERDAAALTALRAVVELLEDETARPFFPAGWDACSVRVLRAIEKEVLG